MLSHMEHTHSPAHSFTEHPQGTSPTPGLTSQAQQHPALWEAREGKPLLAREKRIWETTSAQVTQQPPLLTAINPPVSSPRHSQALPLLLDWGLAV